MSKKRKRVKRITVDMVDLSPNADVLFSQFLDEHCKPSRSGSDKLREHWIKWIHDFFKIPRGAYRDDVLNTRSYLFITLTLGGDEDDKPPTLSRLNRAMDRFIEKSKYVYQTAFLSTEVGTLNGRLHVHGLIELRKNFDIQSCMSRIFSAWDKQGFIDLEVPNSYEAVLNYVTKHNFKSFMELPPGHNWWAYRR